METKKTNSECLICFEDKNLITLGAIKSTYWTSCECNIYIHKKCFNTWVKINDSCPLCRAVYYSKIKYSKEIANSFCKRLFIFSKLVVIYMIISYTIIQTVEIIIHGSIYRD